MNKKKISGLVPVALALAGNAAITVFKFIGFLLSGSGALFSEAVHSFADTANQSLLLVGIKRSIKKADSQFSYGYGQERFVWALISACGIFFVGAGVTVYHGILTLIEPEAVRISPIIFAILIGSLTIELLTFWKAWKELSKRGSSLKEILKNGDPVSLAVLFEDGVAVLGVIVAFASITLTFITGSHLWDAWGSIIIGILLGIVAVVLINKNRELLIEKAMPEEMKEKIIEFLEADPAIEKVLDFKSSTLDAGKYRIKCEVEFNGPALMKEIYKNGFLKNEYALARNSYGEFARFCVDYVDRVPRLIGSKIDRVEEKIKNSIPEIEHIDIEIN